MEEAYVTSKGRLVIPARIRLRDDIKMGNKGIYPKRLRHAQE